MWMHRGKRARLSTPKLRGAFRATELTPLADPTKSLDDALMMADAIDDLADLTSDMREVVWIAEHLGIDDAHFTFRVLFSHWGQHVRELSLYLCGRLWG